MLPDYVPDDYSGSEVQYVRDVHLTQHDESVVHRGRLNQLSGSYYRVETFLGDEENIIAATTVGEEIDWSSLLSSHQYHRSHDGSGHHPSDWPLIRWYSRKRGILLHHYCLRDNTDLQGRAEHLLATPPDEHTHHDVQEAVAEWQHAPRVPHPDEDGAYNDSERSLGERMSIEADAAHQNWQRLRDSLTTRHVADEQLVLGDTTDDHPYGGQIDRLTEIRDGPLPPDVYVLEIKLAADWHPRHLLQAEAHRRALQDDMPDISAAVARLGVKDDDYELITSHDDEWDEEELWDMFCRRAKSLYDSGLYQAALRNAGR
jgi:hypothetical protein